MRMLVFLVLFIAVSLRAADAPVPMKFDSHEAITHAIEQQLQNASLSERIQRLIFMEKLIEANQEGLRQIEPDCSHQALANYAEIFNPKEIDNCCHVGAFSAAGAAISGFAINAVSALLLGTTCCTCSTLIAGSAVVGITTGHASRVDALYRHRMAEYVYRRCNRRYLQTEGAARHPERTLVATNDAPKAIVFDQKDGSAHVRFNDQVLVKEYIPQASYVEPQAMSLWLKYLQKQEKLD